MHDGIDQRLKALSLLVWTLTTVALLVTPAIATAAEPSASDQRSPSPGPAPSLRDEPPGTLQALVDAAAPGAVVTVPSGRYREMVTVHKPLTLSGDGAEIRGSDVWDDWVREGGGWSSTSSVPEMYTGGDCAEPRCAWPEQVFVDGAALTQVATDPGSGEFARMPDGRIVLGDDPTGRTVEVTVRQSWIVVDAPDVTIEGFTMRDAGSAAQFGGIEGDAGADRLTIRRVDLSDAHGALVSFHDLTGGSLLDSRLERGGQLGVKGGGGGVRDISIIGNEISDNGTEGFETSWEAGGIKITNGTGVTIRSNVVTGNTGPGIWCDIDCSDVEITANRVGENSRAGIMFEISDGATITDNVVWDNGWGFATWAWGAGILASSARNVSIERNTVAWNADGISVVSQDRSRPQSDHVTGVRVADNVIVEGPPGSWLLSWIEDWSGGIHDVAADNVGLDNRFWEDPANPSHCRYVWTTCMDALSALRQDAWWHWIDGDVQGGGAGGPGFRRPDGSRRARGERAAERPNAYRSRPHHRDPSRPSGVDRSEPDHLSPRPSSTSERVSVIGPLGPHHRPGPDLHGARW